jgi:hypothetical protein
LEGFHRLEYDGHRFSDSLNAKRKSHCDLRAHGHRKNFPVFNDG